MLLELAQLSKRLSADILLRANRLRSASLFFKVGVIGVGSLVAAAMQFWQFPKEGPAQFQIVGITASLFVFVGIWVVAFTEEDASRGMALARDAIETARSKEHENEGLCEEVDALETTQRQFSHLYSAVLGMRSGIETLAVKEARPIREVLGTLLATSKRSLSIAMGVQAEDIWTISVYEAVTMAGTDKRVLECVAHARAIDCELGTSRKWPEGLGVAGVCCASALDLIIPDMEAAGIGTAYRLGKNLSRAGDDERYRSMAAFPILIDGMDQPWGVVVASSDQRFHFDADDTSGFKHTEAARALAGMTALAVAVADCRVRKGPGLEPTARRAGSKREPSTPAKEDVL